MATQITMNPVTTEKTQLLNDLIKETNKKNLEINERYIQCDDGADYVNGWANTEMMISISAGKIVGNIQRMECGLDDNYLPFSISLQDKAMADSYLVELGRNTLDLAYHMGITKNEELKEIALEQVMLVKSFIRKVEEINAR